MKKPENHLKKKLNIISKNQWLRVERNAKIAKKIRKKSWNSDLKVKT